MGLAGFRLLMQLALRSLWSHKIKSLIVGSLIFFGTFLVVLGLALLDSIETSMARSIVSSLAGHLQVYSKDAKDELALFGSGFMGADDIGEMSDIARVKDALEAMPNVAAVVPMGSVIASVNRPGELDRVLGSLRSAVAARKFDDVATLVTQVKDIGKQIRTDLENRLPISSDPERVKQDLAVLARAMTEEFWQPLSKARLKSGLASETEALLQFLDTKVAPLWEEARLIYLRFLGTDLAVFADHFDRFRIVEGETVPPGHRGALVSKRMMEKGLKHRIARDFDELAEGKEEGRTIAKDAEQKSRASRMPGQYQRITFQLDPIDAQEVETALRKSFPDTEGGLPALVQELLTVTDDTFAERRKLFYELIAPRVQLYAVDVGDILTVRAFTRSGYLKSVNVKIWGVFKFEGLEASDIAGGHNLVDMVTFRELYGRMTDELRAELGDIREAVGAADIGRGSAEDALFGASDDLVELTAEAGFNEFEEVDLEGHADRLKMIVDATYDPKVASRGMALNAAVILKDPATMEQTAASIRDLSEAKDLGLQVVDWKTATGMVGQFVTVVRIVLVVAIFITFLVALVIINNSMVIATMERVSEIGTIRAIGAQRSFVMVMFLVETLVLGLLSGGIGAFCSAYLVTWLGRAGIPARGVDILVFLFSGPRLYPSVAPIHLGIAVVVILVVSLISTFYPAWIATRIQPVTAMQTNE